jgi:Holliday junction resolvase RusA-like endonuclease
MKLDSKLPPGYGELEFSLPVPAVSRQANTTARQQIAELVRTFTRPLEYVLDDDVTIDIEWMLHERSRCETDASADMDNIIKPLLDALCGPDGILIDDCQVGSFSATWMSWVKSEDKVTIRIKYDPDHYLPKKGLVFVRMKDALCYPVPQEVREKAAQSWIEWLKLALTSRAELEKLTGNQYYPARYMVPRGFLHRSRIKGFPVLEPEELLQQASSSS